MQKKAVFSLFTGLLVGFISVFVYNRFLDIVTEMNRFPTMVANFRYGVPSQNSNMGYPMLDETLLRDYSVDGTSFFFQSSDRNENEAHNRLSVLGIPEVDETIDKTFVDYLKRNDFDPRLNATLLNSSVRVLCFSITPRQQLHSAEYQQITWGKHCDKFVVLSPKGLSKKDVIGIDLPDGVTQSWNRLKASLQWILGQDITKYDWFVKVEYDTFIVMENLRYMLLLHQTGIKDYVGQVFSGKINRGSTIVLNHAGLDKLRPIIGSCEAQNGGRVDDLELENCFHEAGVYRREDCRDYTGETRFQMLIPNHEVPVNSAKFVVWYWRFIKEPSLKLPECCSDYAISYMYASPNNMYLLEYMIYHMRPYGIGYYNCPAERVQ